LLQMGFTSADQSPGRWWALTSPFHPYLGGKQVPTWRYVSVARSLGLPPLVVSQHPALWSSDFPRPAHG